MNATAVDALVDVELPGMPEAPPFEPVVTEPTKRGRGRPKGSATKPAAPAPKPPAPPRDASPKNPGGRPSNAAKLEESLCAQIGMIGTAMMLMPPWEGASYDGACVIGGASAIASALAEVAKNNAAVRKTLEAMTNASAWGGVAVAVLAVAAPIAANHGLVPTLAAMFIGGPVVAAARDITGRDLITDPEPAAA